MSRNYMIKENKRLFESRLQIKINSNSKINKIFLDNKQNNKTNISFMNITQPFTKVFLHKNKKNESALDSSSINDANLNTSINKKSIKTKKNRNKKNNFNINTSHNKSNILIKDITFFHLKNSPNENNKQNKTIISVNKRMTTQNSNSRSLNKKNGNNVIGTITLDIKKNRVNNKEINSFSSLAKSINISNENNKVIKTKKKNITSDLYNKLIFKDKFISKFRLKNNQHKNGRNSSSLKKHTKRHNSFLIHKIKHEKKSNLNSTNITDNNIIIGNNKNHIGRNIKIKKNKKIDISTGHLGFTQRNLIENKNYKKIYKNTFGEIKKSYNKFINNSNLNKNANTINYDNKGNISNRNLYNKNYLNNLLLKDKDKDKKISRNYKNNINKKYTYNKFNKNSGTQELISLNNPKKNKTNKIYEDINENNKMIQNGMNKYDNNYKYIDKTEEIIEDNNNGASTKTNDEFYSESKNNIINESSIQEDSGILSMNEIEDIICYNNMYDISKEENYLFNQGDYDNYVKRHKKNLYNLFFGNQSVTYKQSKIKIKKKLIIINDNINKDHQFINDYKDLKIYSYNNSSRKKEK